MNDILSSLKEKSKQPYVKFKKCSPDTKSPAVSSIYPGLYILYASKDYSLDTNRNDQIIDSGLTIEYAINVEMIAFAPYERRFDDSGALIKWEPYITMKEPEFLISEDYRGSLEFPAYLLYKHEFEYYNHSEIFISKGDPICYLKIKQKSSWVPFIEEKQNV